jgi:hypothetical protein
MFSGGSEVSNFLLTNYFIFPCWCSIQEINFVPYYQLSVRKNVVSHGFLLGDSSGWLTVVRSNNSLIFYVDGPSVLVYTFV